MSELGLIGSFSGLHARPDFVLHHDFDVAVVIDFVLLVALACSVLPAATGGTVSEVDAAVLAIKLGHSIRERYYYLWIIIIMDYGTRNIISNLSMTLKLEIQKKML